MCRSSSCRPTVISFPETSRRHSDRHGLEGHVLNGNFVGTTQDGDGTIASGGDGVDINAAPDNALIGCKFVTNPFVFYNVISGNRGNGVHVTSSNEVTIQGDFF
jgi:hypothetical protein